MRTAGPAAGVNEFDTAIYCDPHAVVDVCAARGDDSHCAYFDQNLHQGVTSFDNFGYTTVIILQAITFDAWTISMYGLQAVLGSSFAAILFYLPIVFIGGFFLVQLFLAVLFQQFVEIQEVEKAIEEEQKRTAEVRAIAARMFARQQLQARDKAFGVLRQRAVDQERIARTIRAVRSNPIRNAFIGWRGERDPKLIERATRLQRVVARWFNRIQAKTFDAWVVLMMEAREARQAAAAARDARPPGSMEMVSIWIVSWLSWSRSVARGEHVPLMPPEQLRSDHPTSHQDAGSSSNPRSGWRADLAAVVTSPNFSASTSGLVLLNLVLMTMEYHGMSDAYAARLELATDAITWMFILEFVAKILGLGCRDYWSDGWNRLDGSLVMLSVIEILLTFLMAGSDVDLSLLRVLRLLRVMRMLRLMRSWKGLYKVVRTILNAIPQMSNVFVLLVCPMALERSLLLS